MTMWREMRPGGENSGCPGSRSRYAIGFLAEGSIRLVNIRAKVDFPVPLKPAMRTTGVGPGVKTPADIALKADSQQSGMAKMGIFVGFVRTGENENPGDTVFHTPGRILDNSESPDSWFVMVNSVMSLAFDIVPSFSSPLLLRFNDGRASITGSAWVIGA